MQVVRQRRHEPRAYRRLFAGTRRFRLITAGSAALTLAVGVSGIAYASTRGFRPAQGGRPPDRGLVVSPDQNSDPIGDRLVINNGKIMSSSVSPAGSHLAASRWLPSGLTEDDMILPLLMTRRSPIGSLFWSGETTRPRSGGRPPWAGRNPRVEAYAIPDTPTARVRAAEPAVIRRNRRVPANSRR